MSTMQRLTLIGMYNFDSDLFTNLSLPNGYDSDTFVETLLLDHGEKCVVYPDVDFMKYAIGSVSKKWELELTKIYEALTADYSPIYNYDRYEYYKDTTDKDITGHNNTTWTRTSDETYSHSRESDDTVARTVQTNSKTERTVQTNSKTERTVQTNSKTERTNDSSGTTETQVSAFNSSAYEPSQKVIDTGEEYTLSNTDPEYTDTNTDPEYTDTNTDPEYTDTYGGGDYEDTKSGGNYTDNKLLGENEDTEFIHDAHVYGNIGVKTSTATVNEVIEQRTTKNLYEIAARIFANELTIPIY